MKTKIAVVVLVVVCLLLGAALIDRQKKAEAQKIADAKRISDVSSELKSVSASHEELKQVNIALNTNLTQRGREIEELTNTLINTRGDLARTRTELESAKAAIETGNRLAAELRSTIDQKVTEIGTLKGAVQGLNVEKDQMHQSLVQLTNAIQSLEIMIADTTKRLKETQGEKDFLLTELKRLQAEKAELERQINSLVFLKEQVRKLKEELVISKRLEWIRQGLYGEIQKGAVILNNAGKRTPPPPKTNFNLNVELKTDGSAKIVSPATNAPAAQPK
jgi:chromosome segregation ATPase